MVYLMPAEQCDCISCDGGKPAPKGVLGGSHCLCKCHTDPEYKRKRIKEKQKILENLIKEIKNV